MPITRNDLRRWFLEGLKLRATHMIVVCDTFSHEDHPVYVNEDEDPREKARTLISQPTTRVMEVYSLSQNMEMQLNEQRACHF